MNVEVTGLSSAQLRAIRSATLTDADWSSLFRVAVSDSGPGMLGTYAVVGDAVRFTPQFPLDPGRPYVVRFDPSHLPGTGLPLLAHTVTVPPRQVTPLTTVARLSLRGCGA